MGSMPKFKEFQKPKKEALQHLEQAFARGIPNELRPDVWPLIVPNNLEITQKLYDQLLE